MDKYTYNGIWLNGKLEKKGYRPSEERYEQITKFCKQYTRPFSVLDIGAAEGYFTHRLASEFEGNFTAVEADGGRALLNTCEKNDNSKVFLLQKRFNLEDLKKMAEVHYFDVILALNVVHHFDEPFQEVLDTIMSMCSYCFFEHPDPKEDKKTINFERVGQEKLDLDKYSVKYLIDTDRWDSISRKLYLLENKEVKKITRRYANGRKYEEGEGIVINSSFGELSVNYLHREEERPWHLGMNLRTFLLNNGVYPSFDKIFQYIDECDIDSNNKLGDLGAHNLILDDNKVVAIDQNDKSVDSSKYFYVTEKEMSKAGLMLSFPNAPIAIGEHFVKGEMTSADGKEGPWLVVVSTESGKNRFFTTKTKEHALMFYEIKTESNPSE